MCAAADRCGGGRNSWAYQLETYKLETLYSQLANTHAAVLGNKECLDPVRA